MFEDTGNYKQRTNIKVKKPLCYPEGAIIYDKRPANNCICCWQSRSKNSKFNHQTCKDIIRKFVREQFKKHFPSPDVQIMIENK